MGGGGAQCCSGRRLRLDIAAPIVSRSRPKLLCGLVASQPHPATPRPATRRKLARLCRGRLLMDDGLQHHTLHRDLSLLVLDALQPLGNGRVLPAGPLREPFVRTLGRSDAVCAVAPYADGTGARVAAPPSEAALRDVLGLPPHQHVETARSERRSPSLCLLGLARLALGGAPHSGGAAVLLPWRAAAQRAGTLGSG